MNSHSDRHHALIRDQFTAQSATFGRLPAHSDAIPLLVGFCGVGPDSDVLDVACGPGIVACALAATARSVEGVDLARAMLDQARHRQQVGGLRNLAWREAAAEHLPFRVGTFSHVVTRYSFHHFESPAAVLREMARVCRPGGRVVVADVIILPDKSAAYDRLETLRDPSHVHALDPEAMRGLFAPAGLSLEREGSYALDIELEAQLSVSHPAPGAAEELRRQVTSDIGRDELGISARREGGGVRYSVPIGIFAARRL